jgi:alkaline phosphatase/alkaline phosphatase D
LLAIAALKSGAEIVGDPPSGSGLHLAQGMIAGEVTTASVILQARLTSVVTLTGGDVAGAAGTGCFEVATDTEFKKARRTPWMLATPDADFILKARIDGLLPATTYHYRLVFGTEERSAKPGDSASFKTLPETNLKTAVDFILTSCPNYSFFHEGTKGNPAYQGADRLLGYPALETIRDMKPDFVILNGDCVYYDHPSDTRAKTQAELRRKWHEQHVQPRFVKLFAHTPTYWLKDDHDHRQNDSDATGNYQPSHQLGIDTFREQVPVVNPADPKAVTYRTHRIGHDLQLWFVEGRDYRSPNKMAGGPDKTLWGAEQKAWLMRTLTESDATFKILVSPTPMVGPDDGYKTDNHVNADGFRHEGEAFFSCSRRAASHPTAFSSSAATVIGNTTPAIPAATRNSPAAPSTGRTPASDVHPALRDPATPTQKSSNTTRTGLPAVASCACGWSPQLGNAPLPSS